MSLRDKSQGTHEYTINSNDLRKSETQRDLAWNSSSAKSFLEAASQPSLQKIIHLSQPNQEDDPSKLFN